MHFIQIKSYLHYILSFDFKSFLLNFNNKASNNTYYDLLHLETNLVIKMMFYYFDSINQLEWKWNLFSFLFTT